MTPARAPASKAIKLTPAQFSFLEKPLVPRSTGPTSALGPPIRRLVALGFATGKDGVDGSWTWTITPERNEPPARRPNQTESNMDKKNMRKIVGGVKRSNGKTKWMPLGMAFLNKDGISWSLKRDTIPMDPATTIQLFPIDERDDDDTVE